MISLYHVYQYLDWPYSINLDDFIELIKNKADLTKFMQDNHINQIKLKEIINDINNCYYQVLTS